MQAVAPITPLSTACKPSCGLGRASKLLQAKELTASDEMYTLVFDAAENATVVLSDGLIR